MIHAIKIFAQNLLDPGDVSGIPRPINSGDDPIRNALQLVFAIAGGVALIIITIAALQYILSQGNPQSTAKAKDTILYALVGLAICVLGFTIVRFVVGRL